MSTLSTGAPAATATPSGPQGQPQGTRLVPLLAVGSGVAVADNHYLQPLLAVISRDLGVGVGALGAVAALALLATRSACCSSSRSATSSTAACWWASSSPARRRP